MLYTKQLSAVSDAEIASAGQRAIDLAKLLQARFAVPPSFVVLSTALERFLTASNLKYKLDYLLTRVDPKLAYTLTNAYTGVRKAFLEAPIPTDVERDALEMYSAISADAQPKRPVRLIVSTNRIDDPENNDTVIQCVRTPQEFLTALRESWALAYSPAQLAHRARARFPESKLTVAVIVQAMPVQDATVHAYSSVPQDRARVYLQAYRGYPDLRERVAKSNYAISKEDLKLVASEPREQPAALLLDEKDALELAPVSAQPGSDPIAARDAAEAARQAKKAERELSSPVKAFFANRGEEHQLLWVNRLGFDVLLEPEKTASASPNSQAP